MLFGMAATQVWAAQNLCKISPLVSESSLCRPDSMWPNPTMKGMAFQDHGSCLRRGKDRPISMGSCMSFRQNERWGFWIPTPPLCSVTVSYRLNISSGYLQVFLITWILLGSRQWSTSSCLSSLVSSLPQSIPDGPCMHLRPVLINVKIFANIQVFMTSIYYYSHLFIVKVFHSYQTKKLRKFT